MMPAVSKSSDMPASRLLLWRCASFGMPLPRCVIIVAPASTTRRMSFTSASWCPRDTTMPSSTHAFVSSSAPASSAAMVRILRRPLQCLCRSLRKATSGSLVCSGRWHPTAPGLLLMKGPSRCRPVGVGGGRGRGMGGQRAGVGVSGFAALESGCADHAKAGLARCGKVLPARWHGLCVARGQGAGAHGAWYAVIKRAWAVRVPRTWSEYSGSALTLARIGSTCAYVDMGAVTTCHRGRGRVGRRQGDPSGSGGPQLRPCQQHPGGVAHTRRTGKVWGTVGGPHGPHTRGVLTRHSEPQAVASCEREHGAGVEREGWGWPWGRRHRWAEEAGACRNDFIKRHLHIGLLVGASQTVSLRRAAPRRAARVLLLDGPGVRGAFQHGA